MTLPAPLAVGDKITAAWLNQVAAAVSPAASGDVTVTVTTANVVTSSTITFPTGRFATAPTIVGTIHGANTNTVTGPWFTGVSTTGATVWAGKTTTGNVTVYWQAFDTP